MTAAYAVSRRKSTEPTLPLDNSEPSGVDHDDTITMISPTELHPHPKNPPERITIEHTATLVASISRHGQSDVCRVRPVDGIQRPDRPRHGYEIISGHRRWFACKTLNRPVRCEIIDCDDATALREVVLANTDREDLNAIQRAESMRDLVEVGYTPQQAGHVYGIESVSGVKNLLRLLALPPKMQAMIADGRLPSRAARYAVPFAEATVMIDRWIKSMLDSEWRLQEATKNPETFFRAMWDSGYREVNCRPMDGKTKYELSWQYEKASRKFEVDEKLRARLQVVQVPHPNSKTAGTMVEVAQNVKLFDELNQPFLKRKSDRGSSTAKAKSKNKTSADPAIDTAADKKRREAEAKKVLANRLELWSRRFRLQCIARQTPVHHWVIPATIAWLTNAIDNRPNWISAAIETMGIKTDESIRPHLMAGRETTGALHQGQAVLDRMWRVLIWPQRLAWPIGAVAYGEICKSVTGELPEKCPLVTAWSLHDKAIAAIIEAADVSISGGWRDLANDPAPASMLTEYLNHHSVSQLEAVAKSAGVTLAGVKGKAAMVATIRDHHSAKKPLPLPAVLDAKVKGVKK